GAVGRGGRSPARRRVRRAAQSAHRREGRHPPGRRGGADRLGRRGVRYGTLPPLRRNLGSRGAVASSVEIDVYADLICPWCYIGKRRREAALDGFDGEVTVRYRPFQLDPSTPRGPRPLLEWLGPKFGGPERARAITARTTRVAAEAGIEMHFEDALIANSFE